MLTLAAAFQETTEFAYVVYHNHFDLSVIHLILFN